MPMPEPSGWMDPATRKSRQVEFGTKITRRSSLGSAIALLGILIVAGALLFR